MPFPPLLVIERAYDQTRVANVNGLCAAQKGFVTECGGMVKGYERTGTATDIDETAQDATNKKAVVTTEDVVKSPDDLASIINARGPATLAPRIDKFVKISTVKIHDECRGKVFVALAPNDPSAVVKVNTETRAGERSETGALCDEVRKITSWGKERTQDTTGVAFKSARSTLASPAHCSKERQASGWSNTPCK